MSVVTGKSRKNRRRRKTVFHLKNILFEGWSPLAVNPSPQKKQGLTLKDS